jgi:hypothetical protein
MFGSLITLPLRVGRMATELTLRGAHEIARRAAEAVGLGSDRSQSPTEYSEAPPHEPEAAPTPPEAEVVPPEPEIKREATFTADYDTPTPVEPIHLSEDAELVEEVAEAGAEDGAGAQVRVAEPWDGYRQLKAADVINRLGSASSEELAAIELFELFGRKRQTVIAAAQRELSRRG